MDDKLKEALQGDYSFTVIYGHWPNCPTCDGSPSNYYSDCFYSESDLIKKICDDAGGTKYTGIYINGDCGEILHYSDIKIEKGYHSIHALEFELPVKGKVRLVKFNGAFMEDTDANRILFGNK